MVWTVTWSIRVSLRPTDVMVPERPFTKTGRWPLMGTGIPIKKLVLVSSSTKMEFCFTRGVLLKISLKVRVRNFVKMAHYSSRDFSFRGHARG